MLHKEVADQWLIVCFQVNHGSVIVTMDSGSRVQSSDTNITKLVLLVQQNVSASTYLYENQPIFK